jgi:predicted phosphodiesterase
MLVMLSSFGHVYAEADESREKHNHQAAKKAVVVFGHIHVISSSSMERCRRSKSNTGIRF